MPEAARARTAGILTSDPAPAALDGPVTWGEWHAMAAAALGVPAGPSGDPKAWALERYVAYQATAG